MLKPEDIGAPFTSEVVYIDGLPVVVPILGVKFGETALQLHWWNSTILTFDNVNLNHVEYKGEEGKKGIAFDEDMLEHMGQMLYPMYYRPIPDESTLKWYSQVATRDLDIELRDL